MRPGNLAVVFDTETTGLIDNRTMKANLRPCLLEVYACRVDLDSGAIEDELWYLVRPPSKETIDLEVSQKSHGLTWESVETAPEFKTIAEEVIQYLGSRPTLIAHNLSFDMEIIEIEAERIGTKVSWPRHRVCTVEQTVYLKGYRLSLSALHELLFAETFADAHRARTDVGALVRCCVELRKRGIL